MRLLRRSTPSTPEAAPDAAATPGPAEQEVRVAGGTAGKGRPTPKRREAEGRRRGPAPTPPRTQREASKLAKANRPSKEQRRAARTRESEQRRAGIARGDERYLPPRDRGPLKAYIRDLVDARPNMLGLFMPLALIVVISAFVPVPAFQQYMSIFSLALLIVMVGEGLFLGSLITKKVRVKFPDEQVRGLSVGWYAFTRATQLRKIRIPKPRVSRGAKV